MELCPAGLGVLLNSLVLSADFLALSVALPLPYAPARFPSGALVAHRTFQYCRTFVPFLASLWSELSGPECGGVGLAGFKSRVNAFLVASSVLYFYLLLFSSFLPTMGLLCGVGVL